MKNIVEKLRNLTGSIINDWWNWYQGGGVKYRLIKANNRQVVVRCSQNGRTWDLTLKPSEFIRQIDWDYFPFPRELG